MTARKPKDELQKRGRKSLFRPEYHIRIAEVAAKYGATDEEIAEDFGIALSNFKKWRVKFPELEAALKENKAAADARMERSLYRRGIGYSYRAEKVVVESLGNNGGSEARVVEYTETMPPDPTSMIFWLKNRAPDRWRDVQRIDAAMGHYVISDHPMTEEEWAKERAIADKTIDVVGTVVGQEKKQ